MQKIGDNVGRSRKPFLEKSTNLYIKVPNKQIVDLLDIYQIEYEMPKPEELTFKSETLNPLIDEIKNLLEEKIKNCKK